MSISSDSLPPNRPTLAKAFDGLVRTLNERKVQYAIIGGIATLQHTRVRTTDDIDALLILPQIGMAGFFEALQARGFTVQIERNIREIRDHGLTVIHFEGVVVDLLRPVIPMYTHVLERAVTTQILGLPVRVSSAEGLILMKLIAMRPQDEADIRDLLIAYGGKLDLGFVRTELAAVMEPNDPRLEKLNALVIQATSQPNK